MYSGIVALLPTYSNSGLHFCTRSGHLLILRVAVVCDATKAFDATFACQPNIQSGCHQFGRTIKYPTRFVAKVGLTDGNHPVALVVRT
jgi:hypothetical protein